MKFKKNLGRNNEMFRLKNQEDVVNLVVVLDYQNIQNTI